MNKYYGKLLLSLFVIALAIINTIAQEMPPAPSPTPPDEPIKIFTEEVKLNVIAQSAYSGEKVPNLKADDLLVVESGDPQTITSIKQVPASVLILLDTGKELNAGKENTLTRLMAKVLVKNLSDKDTISVIQYYNKIETIADWTKDKALINDKLDKRMFLGERSRFVDALHTAVDSFKSRPLENRNLILISDGIETVRGEEDFQKAIRKVLEANISVHIISYTALQRQNAAKRTGRFRINKEKTPPRIPDYIFETILDGITMRRVERQRLKMMLNEQQRVGVINLDKEMIRFIENKRKDWEASEIRLKKLALETGGEFHAPESTEYMLKFADDVARSIGSQYVITYTPTKSFSDKSVGNERKIRVSTHRIGVRIKARQKLFINENVEKEN